MTPIDKIKFWLSLSIRILLIIAISFSIFRQNWINLLLAVVTLVLTFLPTIIEHRYKIDWPSEFEIGILVFIYASLYLGEIHSFYQRFWWWDIFLHAFSSVIIGGIGFTIVMILNAEKKVRLSPAFVALFSFSFGISIGALWEIFEFAMDMTLGTNMQKSGLMDTMTDLIVDSIGALVVSYSGFLYLKGRIDLFKKMEGRFRRSNPRLFKD